MFKTTLSVLSRFITRIKSVLKDQKRDKYTIDVHSGGIKLRWHTFEGELHEHSHRWEEVSSVTTYKRDLAMTDMVCLLFAFSDGTQFEFNEEMPCWQCLVDLLPKYLPGCPAYSEWWHNAVFKPFKTSEKTLFQRNNISI